jgi:hypothetical protein
MRGMEMVTRSEGCPNVDDISQLFGLSSGALAF